MPHPKSSLNEIRLVRGQTKVFQAKVKTKAGRKANLQDVSVFMSIQKQAGSPVLVTKSTPKSSGIEVTNPADGEITVTLSTYDTDSLNPGTYRYDLWVEFPGDPPVRHPVVKFAELRVVDSVTQFGS